MKIRDLILSSGLTMKELLLMKGNFRAFRKQNYDPDEPMIEGEDLKAYILDIADSSSWVSIVFWFTIVSTVGQYYVRNDLKSACVIFFICLPWFVYSIYKESKDVNLKMTTIIKMVILHYRIKAKKIMRKFN